MNQSSHDNPPTDPLLNSLVRLFAGPLSLAGLDIPLPDGRAEEVLRLAGTPLRAAAVLIPVLRPTPGEESHIVLTLRSARLSSHAGQVSLPGGTRNVDDATPIDTALREAEEEIGLLPAQVEILGQMGRILLPSGYEVTPVIGVVDSRPVFRPCPIEVEEVFTVPSSLLLNPGNYRVADMEYKGQVRKVLELYYGKYRIWGATAAILNHLARQLSSLSE